MDNYEYELMKKELSEKVIRENFDGIIKGQEMLITVCGQEIKESYKYCPKCGKKLIFK